jgi:hypothetical protein
VQIKLCDIGQKFCLKVENSEARSPQESLLGAVLFMHYVNDIFPG